MRGKSFGQLFYVFLFLCAAITGGCDSNSSDPDLPGIGGESLAVTGGRGTSTEIVLNLEAEAGIQSLTVAVNGGSPQPVQVNTGATEQVLTYEFAIPASSVLGTQYSLLFTLTDNDDEKSDITATVTTVRLIDTPETYSFTRNGESTVSHSGQNDRLNMVQEMKAYLTTGDAGGQMSEQVLLDMFANTGGNGGGRFSFTSDRQLKDKTFAPDLDDRLFENLFASAAAASGNGNSGTSASKGTAGLIAREDNGKTILVDEKGREFTQLIEKGLMGAVFYSQIFNAYLTDNRIGELVENVEPAPGESYTPMEHHWDEAFGYWNPPLDFTSQWPEARKGELRFWTNYSNVVENVGGGQLGTNSIIMDAFKEGRTAIVNNDPISKNDQRDILYEYLELVAAATAVHYINDTLGHLDAGKTGEALHTLSEAWAFVNSLRYSPRRSITLAQVNEIQIVDFGADGNFWDVTPAGLNKAKATLVGTYSKLASVQNDL
ncbi:MAG TPA: DUF4856 domain-containing protein [Rhodothermales bacterium]|nr:DUF4856 domain-containing protein [Rhodothermales bacterium]